MIRRVFAVARYNFRSWRKNPRIVLAFLLAFILSFLLSDKAVRFAREYETTMQLVEAFVWTFGDSSSILLSSLLLLLLFADMPFITAGTPFYLVRIDRKTWIAGQALYMIAATFLYLLFVLFSTCLVCMRQSFIGNMWSETAAILGYSGAGQKVALPALVKTLEMSRPYECMAVIFLLMLLYALLLRWGGCLRSTMQHTICTTLAMICYRGCGRHTCCLVERSFFASFLLCVQQRDTISTSVERRANRMDAIISVRDVSKNFGKERVLHHISRDFEKGKIHGIIGNNGSGKTVLMKCICGFLTPTEGEIFVQGKQVGRDMDFPPDMGIIIETPGFLPGISGTKNLELLAALNKRIALKEIAEAIRRVGLDPELKKPVGKYSLGMRQRLGIAQAIMEDPGLLILDEPLNGLDKHGVKEMRNLIRCLKDEGKTILLASHNQGDIDELCDTVCEMDAGKMTMIREG